MKPIIEDRQGFSNAGEFYKFHIERIEKEVEKLSKYKMDITKIHDIGKKYNLSTEFIKKAIARVGKK